MTKLASTGLNSASAGAANVASTGFGDARGVESLKSRASKDPKAAVKEAAKQFETLFMQQLLKTMREATKSDSSMDNDASKLGAEMLDTQWSTKLSGRPGGLADVIARQLDRQVSGSATSLARPDSANLAATRSTASLARPQAAIGMPQQSASDFVTQHTEAATQAEATTGIPASFMIAQAAHETGWGKHEIRHQDGSTAHNLFGIKAGSNWTGDTVNVTTTEYSNGQPHKVVQKFRAYGSYAESFADYAKLMKDNPRYERVVASGSDAHSFASGLQKAGYATDPAYAQKLSRVINTTLRLQRSVQT
jgi:flagellar protein FlgJ